MGRLARVPNLDPAAPAVLRISAADLTRNGRTLLSGIDLTIQPGEHWALIGPNGAGKTTLLSLCGAITHPSRGEVHVLGHQLGRVDLRQLRGEIGHVNPRHPVPRPLTVHEVVLTGATGTNDLIPRWLPSAEQDALARELTGLLGIGPIADERWPTLSQGERGRALIARALMPRPRLLLLDEPATGLDVAAREQLMVAVTELAAKNPELASVLVTHHLEELPPSTTHAMLLRGGEVLAAGRAADVLSTENVSRCFAFPLTIRYAHGRWSAHSSALNPTLD